jgi:hypothetical protein
MKKLPKNWNKMTNDQQRKYISERLQVIRNEEEKLCDIFRKLVTNGLFVSRVDERPDEDKMKA